MKTLFNKYSNIIIAILVVLLAGGMISSFYFSQKANEKEQFDYTEFYTPVVITTEDPANPEETVEVEVLDLSLQLLKQKNPDVVAIIEFDDKIIEEAIVQASDNDYYVRRDLEGKKAAAGASFIDCNGSLTSENTVIYGHSSTKRNIIFTPLMEYKSHDYFTAHPAFTLETEEGSDMYLIFSVFMYDTEDESQTPDFVTANWEEQTDKSYYLVSLKERSMYETGVSVDSTDKLVTLVTCDTEDGGNRLVIVAKKF